LLNIDQIHSLVIDEADRMVEKGHFEELEKLCLHINKYVLRSILKFIKVIYSCPLFIRTLLLQ